MRRRLYGLVFLASAAISGLAPSAAQAQTPPDNVRMQRVVRLFVAQTGQQVLSVGSWIRGNYGPGSDHDMRLVLPPGTPPEQAAARWAQARTTLNSLIEQEFRGESAAVRGRTNFYPPSQVMGGVEDAEEAMARYQRYSQVPNLAHVGAVTRDTPARFAEGLYGQGSAAWLQNYERAAGRLFYQRGGQVFAGLTDLTHMEEGLPRFTMDGMAHTSLQWADHAADEARAGRADKVAKYLARIQRDVAKARDLGRLQGTSKLQEELRFLISELTHEPAKLAKLGDRINEALWKTRVQSSVFKLYAKVPAGARAMLGALIGDMKSDSLSRYLLKASDKGLGMERALNGLVLVFRVHQTARAAGEGDYTAALTKLAPFLLDLGPQILAEMTQMVIDAAKEAGYDFVASSQEAWDLMAGVFTAVGRQSADAGRGYTLDDLVKQVHAEPKLSALVYAKAMLAAARNAGVNADAADAKVAEAIWQRCHPVIRDAWRYRLDELYAEYEALADDIQTQGLLIGFTPNPPVLSNGLIAVSAEATSADGKLETRLSRLKEILGLTTRKGGYVSTTYTWNGGDEMAENQPWRRRFSLQGPGPHALIAELGLDVGSDEFGADTPVKERFIKLVMRSRGAVDVGEGVPSQDGPIAVRVEFSNLGEGGSKSGQRPSGRASPATKEVTILYPDYRGSLPPCQTDCDQPPPPFRAVRGHVDGRAFTPADERLITHAPIPLNSIPKEFSIRRLGAPCGKPAGGQEDPKTCASSVHEGTWTSTKFSWKQRCENESTAGDSQTGAVKFQIPALVLAKIGSGAIKTGQKICTVDMEARSIWRMKRLKGDQQAIDVEHMEGGQFEIVLTRVEPPAPSAPAQANAPTAPEPTAPATSRPSAGTSLQDALQRQGGSAPAAPPTPSPAAPTRPQTPAPERPATQGGGAITF